MYMHSYYIITENLSFAGDNAKEELVSVFTKTSQHLQEMVRGYETKVNQTTDYISCLQNYISLLHDQLAHKNQLIGRMCDRYVSLCKEKQTSVGVKTFCE